MGEQGHSKLASARGKLRRKQWGSSSSCLRLQQDVKKIFKLPEAAASIGDLLEAVKLAFSLGEGSRLLTCSSLDGFDMEPWLAAWEVLERDMKLKVEWKRACAEQGPAVQEQQQRSERLQISEASEAGGQAQEARVEESSRGELAAVQEQQQPLDRSSQPVQDRPQVPKESEAGGAKQEAKREKSPSGGLLVGEEASGLPGLSAPRPAGQMETRSCSGCRVVGNTDLFGGAGWGNPNRKCARGRCWAQDYN